jgi:hypothetical protein
MKSINFKINPKIVLRREGKEAILFNPKNGDIEIVNETGAFILGLCNGSNEQDVIISKALNKFSGDRKKIRSDILKFMNYMHKTKVIGGVK